MDTIAETALAKVNLDLRICQRRSDGYHDLDSLVVFAGAGDHLTFEPADRLTLTIQGPFGETLPSDQRNLVISAAETLARMAGRRAEASIVLDKHLPVAAGLGGGSADAAAALRGLTRLWDLALSKADLMPLARTLGADVPICLGSRAARMEGIGDRLTSVALPDTLPMVLVNPGQAVSTPEVFAALRHWSGARVPDFSSADSIAFRDHLKRSVNDLEAPAMGAAPLIKTALYALRHQKGCVVARMSGSGATCFALFDDMAACELAAADVACAHPDWWVAATEAR